MNKQFILTAVFALSMPAFMLAQQAYTLQECIDEALKNNRQLLQADNDITAASEQKKSAFTNFFPTVSASGATFTANKPLVNLAITPEMSMAMLKNGTMGSVGATMPLFAGGKIVNSNKLAALGVTTKRLSRQLSENDVKLNVTKYYWQTVVLKEKLKTLSIVDSQLESICKDVNLAVEAGLTNRNDLLQVKLRQNEIKSTSINVRNSLQTVSLMLSREMGIDGRQIATAGSVSSLLPPNPDALFISPSDALPQTNEYALLNANVEAQRLQYRLAVGKNLPTVAIGGSYSRNNLLDTWRSTFMGFATVSIPISGWWGGSHDMKKQRLEQRNAELERDDKSQLLMIGMQNSWSNLTDAYEQLKIAVESIEQATENLRLQTDYYHAGTCTMSDLLEAETLFQQSRDNYVDRFAAYEIDKTTYLQSTGR